MTWVMPMSPSSTALARKKTAAPVERTMTKSVTVDHSTVTSPRMTSSKRLTPWSGVRKRTDWGRPSASKAARWAAVSSRQRPS